MIVFVAAESREFSGLVRHVGKQNRLKWPVQFALSGELNGREVLLISDGPGPGLAAGALATTARQGPAEAIVSVGFCGSLLPDLQVASIVIATAIVDASGTVKAETALPTWRSGEWKPAKEKLLSINRVAVTAEEKTELAKCGGGVVEMEAAGLCQLAARSGAPLYGIKVVTDKMNEGFSIDFNGVRDSDGRFSRSMIIKEACRNPFKLFPELMQFDRRCTRAAAVLGDFIADCQF